MEDVILKRTERNARRSRAYAMFACLFAVIAVVALVLTSLKQQNTDALGDADYKALLALDIMSASAVCSASRMARTDMDTKKDMDACIGEELKKKAQSA